MQKGIFVVDCRYHQAVEQAFGALGTFIPSVCCKELAEPVSCHPDMALYPAGDGTVICAPSVYEDYCRILSPFGINLVQGKRLLQRDYPNDVAYNVLNAKNCAFARWDATDEHIKQHLDGCGVRRLHVAQGYSRCTALAAGDNMVTADLSIAKTAKHAGLKVLTISPGFISLPGYAYGFIGGASGVTGDQQVMFFGDLNTHPDGATIRNFLTNAGFKIYDLPGQPLVDIGTILCLFHA